MRFAGKNALFMIMLATMMIPSEIGMIPTFMIFRWLGWIDTFLPLIVPAWLGSAFFAFLYRQFFMEFRSRWTRRRTWTAPDHSASSGRSCCLWRRPVTVTVAVYTFLGAWNSFLGPLIYINSDHKRTLSLALAKFQTAVRKRHTCHHGGGNADANPVVIIYFFSQRALVQGWW